MREPFLADTSLPSVAASLKISVAPALLLWGRQTAGYTLDEAAHKVGISPDKLAAAESGEGPLTYTQLRNLSNGYKRPLAAFFLDQPPPCEELIHDFRLGLDFQHRHLSPRLNFELRKARHHRDEALELAAELGEVVTRFSHTANLNESPEDVAKRLRALFGVSMEAQFAFRDNGTALKAWKQAIEGTGVLVFETSRIEVDEMRGVSLPADYLPVVILNGGDAHAGRNFTLIHEFTHLLLRQGGLCDLVQGEGPSHDARLEAFCNAVAAATLLPAENLRARLPDLKVRIWAMEELQELADAFCVSKEAVLRRLLTLKLTTREHYESMRALFLAEYRRLKERPGKSSGGPSPAVMAVRNLGRPYVRLVLGAYAEDRISLSAVSGYLGVKLKHLERIEGLIQKGEVAA
jgi:Zn-dependent peptidase ImmA (M78 family)/transcriptional regulator with XRE-family HTH domain